MTAPSPHTPVMLTEALHALAPRDEGVYVDGTFGAGGYAHGILGTAACTVWGIDRDPDAVDRGQQMATDHPGRLQVIEGRYGNMVDLLADKGVRQVDGIALDLGVSSMQLDEADRGFSFRFDGPLDMRMEAQGPSAADVVNHTPEKELASIIYTFGEERASRRIAHALVEAREHTPITRTLQLAAIVRACVRKSKDGIDPATRTFQALRIFVNDELGELDRGLVAVEALLSPGGRLAVVSFHSLEDRRVKTFLKTRSGNTPRPSRHLPDIEDGPPPTFRLLKTGTIKPSEAECAANPRARSARLRAAERTSVAPWPIKGRAAA